MITRQILLASRPKGKPTAENFRMESRVLPELQEGDVLLEGMYYSVDPYMRGRMNDARSYAPPFVVDQPVQGGVIASVVETRSSNFSIGDVVQGMLSWSELVIAPDKGLRKIDVSVAPPSYYLGVLGMPGLTAYIGLTLIGNPKAGETVVVSGAAGAVGIVAGQIAKAMGCLVIGLTGSEEKTRRLRDEFGFDSTINYKTTPDLKKALSAACPSGVDVYFDNVGGEISDAVISQINFHGRVILCGQISLYNSTEVPMGPRIQPILLTRSVLMQGFIVSNYPERFPEASRQLAQWVRDGKLVFTETILQGFEQLPAALIGLFNGANTGKMIVRR